MYGFLHFTNAVLGGREVFLIPLQSECILMVVGEKANNGGNNIQQKSSSLSCFFVVCLVLKNKMFPTVNVFEQSLSVTT